MDVIEGFACVARPLKKGSAMNAVVFEHAPVAELPEKWRARLAKSGDALVTVRIEEEAQAFIERGQLKRKAETRA